MVIGDWRKMEKPYHCESMQHENLYQHDGKMSLGGQELTKGEMHAARIHICGRPPTIRRAMGLIPRVHRFPSEAGGGTTAVLPSQRCAQWGPLQREVDLTLYWSRHRFDESDTITVADSF